MPRGDRTGPLGQGPRTGRAAGYCSGYQVPGYMNPGGGRGLGFGRGMGRGRGMGYGRGFGRGWAYGAPGSGWYSGGGWGAAPPAPEGELDALKSEAAGLDQALKDIRGRIAELESKA